jgi:hypothetical protein
MEAEKICENRIFTYFYELILLGSSKFIKHQTFLRRHKFPCLAARVGEGASLNEGRLSGNVVRERLNVVCLVLNAGNLARE